MSQTYNSKVTDVYTNSNLNTRGVYNSKVIQYVQVLFRGDINVFMLTIVYWFQSPITSSRAGMSLSPEVIITSSKSEMSLRSNVS